MKMTGIMLVLAIVLACSLPIMMVSYAADASDMTDATFTDVIMNVGADETERNLTWYSNYDTTGEVQYAKAENMTGDTFPDTYSIAKARVSATNENGSYAYKATIKNLEADTRYVYRLVTGATVSEVRYFEVKDFDDSFSFIYLADPQVGSATYKSAWIDTLSKINSNFTGTSFIVSGGDQVSTSTSEDDYNNFIVDGLSEIAIAPSNGPGHDNSALYADHFNLPNLSFNYGVSAATSDYYYTYNSALFVHINIDNRETAEHVAFIENAIKNNPDAIWQIVVIHWSFYSGSDEGQNATLVNVAKNLVGNINDLGIDLVLSGHDHFYARSELITDYNTISSDVVTNNTVTDPVGTLYVCASTATANGIATPGNSDYCAYQNYENRKSVVNITMSEGALKLDAYFLDGDTPELFDSFTINRTAPKVRVNSQSDMLELSLNGERAALVNAYTYSKALVKVVDGYWSVSTDGGLSFASLGKAASTSYESSVVLRIDDSTGYWQLSEDNGSSYENLPVNIKRYSVTYVTDTGVDSGADLSAYNTVTYVEGTEPDAPSLVLPAGSFDEGIFYEWSWVYKNKDGSVATEFTAGNEYIAYITADISRISNNLYIGATTNKSEGIYTWSDAWGIATEFSDEAFTFTLTQDITATATITLVSKTNVTVDLAGYTLKTSGASYAINYNTGSTGSSFALVSSKAGGTVNSKSFVCLTTSQVSSVNVSYGSDEGYPITLNANDSTYGYLLFAGGNFKRGSTVNFSIKNGTYTATNGILYVDNAADDLSAANHYKVDINNANITLGNSPVCFKGARKASASSYLNATDSTISISSGTASVVASDQWYGSFSFHGCALNGVTFADSGITNIGNATFGDGTVFTNSDVTFNTDKTAFASAKLTLDDGCNLYANGSTVEVSSEEPLPDNVLLIAKTANHSAKIYTWLEAWNIAMANPNVAYIFMLTEDSNMGGIELLKVTAKCNVTLDLAGYAMKVSENSNYLVSFNNGSSGSSFSVISSKAGGSYYGPTLVYAASSGASNLTFSFGSQESYPITVTTFKTYNSYSSKGSLVGVDGNFKNGSTLTANITNGTYILEGEVLSARNYSGNLNTFKINISNADITVGTAVISFASTHNTTATSCFNALNSTISAASGTLSFAGANQWCGSFEFANCEFDGIVFDPSVLSNVSGGIFKAGCSFANYGATFNDDTSAFACEKLTCESGFAPTVNADGTVIIDEMCSHNEVSIEGQAPTCTNTGLTNGVKCSECGEILVAQETIPALGHSYNTEVTDPDCVNGGYTTYTCATCGHSYTADETSALGHTEETVAGKAPTCTEAGLSDGKKCSVCGETLVTQIEIPALGHSYNTEVTDPNCVNGGYTTYTCSACGDSYIGNETNALGHTDSDSVLENVADATCTENGGYDTVVYCSACSAELSRVHTIVYTEGHNYKSEVTDPDCVNGGYTTYTCATCGHSYTADETSALGHTEEAVAGKAPNCTEAGLTDGKKCSVCGETLVTQTEIPAPGHDYNAVVTAPTCTEAGYTIYTCSVCNDTYVADEVEANGHEWTNATTEFPKTCKKCGKTEGEKLPELKVEIPQREQEVNVFARVWLAIINFFRNLFGLPEISGYVSKY